MYLLAALVFAGQLFTTATVTVLLGFICFCLTASSVYVLNDLVDAERDKLHPRKRNRPIPAGQIAKPTASLFLGALLALWIPTAFLLSFEFGFVSLAYFLLNLAYSFKLKHIFLLDVMIIAVGFLLRALAGSVLIHVPISPWLFACTLLLSLFLGLGKRRHELTVVQQNHRAVLEFYSLPLVDQFLTAISSSTIMAYSLYTFFATAKYEMICGRSRLWCTVSSGTSTLSAIRTWAGRRKRHCSRTSP